MIVSIFTNNTKMKISNHYRFSKYLKSYIRNVSKWTLAERYSPTSIDLRRKPVLPKNSRLQPIYSCALPPPNVTGALHLGHALSATLQDVLVRWKRMCDFEVCWLHGTDHAGIATQALFEKHLQARNTSRLDLGYSHFQTEISKLTESNKTRIRQQLQRLEISLDYSREVFTMDDIQTKAVKEAFIILFDAGLIHRKNNLVNWSCQLQTTISDIEVQNLDIHEPTSVKVPGYLEPIKFGLMTEFAYKIKDSNEEIIVATTRPETMLGDVAVAVNPADTRYSHLNDKQLLHPFSHKTIPLIFDDSVDMNFGTGAVKITPAHDRKDYDIANRHSLDIIPVIDEAGNIEKGFDYFSGMKRYDARNVMIEKLNDLRLLRDIKTHKMTIPICSRSGDVIELLPRVQWYINCKNMAKAALNSVKDGSLKLVPEHFETKWFQWLEEEKDWCISRQLWWGHKMPVYKCFKSGDKGNFIWVAANDLESAKLKSRNILQSSNVVCEQESDVLDTWFSSALYPFSAHKWPEPSSDLNKFYPLNLMVTGHDILCFWVCRMVMLGKQLTDKLPFQKVLLHGIICDASGSKMSKSKGNVIDPEDVINGISLSELNEKANISHKKGILSKEEYNDTLKNQSILFPEGIPQCGADALRFTLCSRNIKSHYINFDIKDCHLNKLFCNKIWQSVKYTFNILNAVNEDVLNSTTSQELKGMDLWLLSRLSHLIDTIDISFNNYDFHIATASLKQFLYNDVCDVYIECTKINTKSQKIDHKKLSVNLHILSACLNAGLRMLSPFMPQLTRELIKNIPLSQNCIHNFNDSIDNLSFPKYETFSKWSNKNLESNVDIVLDIISTARQMKNLNKIPKKILPILYIEGDVINESIFEFSEIITYLSPCKEFLIKNKTIDNATSIWSYNKNKTFKISMVPPSSYDATKHIELANDNIAKKRDELIEKIEKMERTRSAEGFKNAPKNVHISYNNKIIALKEELNKIDDKISVQN